MSDIIYVATAADENYARGLLVMLATLLKSNKELEVQELSIIILDGGLSNDTKNKINLLPNKLTSTYKVKFSYIIPNLDSLDEVPKLWGKSNLTLARLQIAELVPETDYIYWIDSDFIINLPLPSFNILDGNMLAASIEPHLPTLEQDFVEIEYPFGNREDVSKPYFNAGFMLINLQKWRDENFGNRAIKAMCENPQSFTWLDQSAINFFAVDKITILPRNYNYNLHGVKANEYLKENWIQCNLHLTGELKPWAINSFQAFFYFQHLLFLCLENLLFQTNNSKELNYLKDISYTKSIKWKIKMIFSALFNKNYYLKKKAYLHEKLKINSYLTQITATYLSK